MTGLCLSFDIHHCEIEGLSFLTLWRDFRKEASFWHRFRLQLLILTRLAGLFVGFGTYWDFSAILVHRTTQWIMYIYSQENRSQNCILLIVRYKYIKSCSGDFYSPEPDPPHKIMRYWVYQEKKKFITQPSCVFDFPWQNRSDRNSKMIWIGGVPVLKRHSGGAGP